MLQLKNEFITTTEACEILGLSKTVIKQMADSGKLESWKTPGGHRRLKHTSVIAYAEEVSSIRNYEKKPDKGLSTLDILVVDSSSHTRAIFDNIRSSMDIPLNITLVQNGYDSLVKAGANEYKLVFVELDFPEMDGYQLINAIKNSTKNANSVFIITTKDAPDRNGISLIPVDSLILNRPIEVKIIKQILQHEWQAMN